MARPRRTSSAALAALGPESCAVYLRISQDRTGEQLGVDRQERECRDLARRLGLAVDKVFTDNDVSATSGRVRPGFEALLKASPEVIIAWHQDRLLRKGADLERVIDLNVPVHTVTAGTLDLTNPAGRAVARTVAAWSTYEGEQKALRQQAANRQRAESGHWTFSRRPYGYERVNGAVRIIEAEAEIVREGYRRYIAGESYYAIAADWNARGVATFTEAWSTARVRQMLRNERYAGIVEVDGERLDVPASWPAIIDDRTWSDYAATRDGRTRAGSWSTSTKHLLSGMLVCGVCGSGMLSRPDRGRLYYTCKASWCVSTLQEDADALVEGVVLARLADKGIVRALRHVPDTAPLQDELASLRKRRDAVTELLADGLIDRRKAREQLTDLTAKLDRTATRLGALRRESPLTDLALARSVPTRWRRLSVLEQRRVIEELGLRVTVNKGRRGPRRRGADGQPLPDFDRYAFEWLDAAAAVTE